MPRPVVGRSPVKGPFLFLGIVARGEDGGAWACRAACVQPILSPEVPMPVDSGYERRALAALRCAAADLARDTALSDALGGPVRVELEKPLFPFIVRGGPCVNGGGIMHHAERSDGPVAAAQKCANHGPLSVATRGRRCTAWSSMRRFDWRLSTRV